MKNVSKAACAALLLVCTGACANQGALVFGTSDTVGISASGSAGETGAQLTVGFREQNAALAPVFVMPEGAEGSEYDPRVVLLGANDAQTSAGHEGASDTFSVFGSFSLRAETKDPNANLGRFFATGLAARELARGFACREAAEGYRTGATATNAAITADPANCMAGRATLSGEAPRPQPQPQPQPPHQ
ncbi:hypothetical protein [Terricaulis sp.]|uniref:hypothetical protein n=1 Tax=Terricaulis sp. TaxID=2768686 RepID=UPI003783A1BA